MNKFNLAVTNIFYTFAAKLKSSVLWIKLLAGKKK